LWDEARSLAETSVRLAPRSSFAYSLFAYVDAMVGEHEAAMEAAQKAVALNPYDMGARGVLGVCHYVIGEHDTAIELFSTAAQRGNSDPRYQWAVLSAFSHYLIGQYDASLSWARESSYSNPNHLQGMSIRAAALAQLGRSAEAKQAADLLIERYPWLTVERLLSNIRWKRAEDIARYREGLLKAGLRATQAKVVWIDPATRRAGES
jgi:adenylate cyclase